MPGLRKSIRWIVAIVLLFLASLSPYIVPEGPCIASHVLINEFEQDPEGSDSGNEWVELFNPTTEKVNVLAWKIETGAGERQTYQITEASVSARGFLIIVFPSLFLNNVDESLTLVDRNGNRVDSTPPLTDTSNDQRSWQRIPDGLESAIAWQFMVNTKESSNAAAEQGTNPSPFCDPSLRIALAISFSFLALVAPLIPLQPWKKKEGKKKEEGEKKEPTEPTRLYVYFFAILLALLVFELWEKTRIPELAPIEHLKDMIISVAAIIVGGGGIAAFLHGRHAAGVARGD